MLEYITWMLEPITGEKSMWFWGMAQFFVVAISLAFIYRQIKLHRQGNMLQAIAGIDQKWGTEAFIKYRHSTCDRYSQNTLKIDRSESEVLAFFEDLGIYLKRGVFDKSLLWDKYSYSIEHYWIMFEKHILEYRAQENDDTWFDQFEYLNSQMSEYANKKNFKYGARTKEEIKKFIRGEKEEALKGEKQEVSLSGVAEN